MGVYPDGVIRGENAAASVKPPGRACWRARTCSRGHPRRKCRRLIKARACTDWQREKASSAAKVLRPHRSQANGRVRLADPIPSPAW